MTVVIGILASICSITRMILHMCRKSFAKSVISSQCLAGSPIGRLAGSMMPVVEGHTYNCTIPFLYFPLQALTGDLYLMVRSSANFV